MRRLTLWAGLWLLVSAASSLAQTPAAFLGQLATKGKPLKQFEATLTTQAFTAGGPVTTRQKVTFAAPDKLRVETVGGDVPQVDWQVTVCSGSASYIFSPATKRLLRWKDENLLDKWTREIGGPANVANFGTAFEGLSSAYTVNGRAGERLRDRPTYLLTLTEQNPTRLLVNDFVRTGGGLGYPIFFNVYKRSIALQPPRVNLTFDAERGVLLRREHYDDRQRLVETADATEVKEVASGLWFPVAFEVRDGAGQLVSKVSYDVKLLDAAPAPNLFTLPPMPDAVAEDAVLQSIAKYRQDAQQKPNDADAHFNLALALWRHTQDINAAIAELDKVTQLKPQAVIPRLAAAEILLVGRRYKDALTVYNQALQSAPIYPGLRAAKGLLAQRTYQLKTATAEFESAVKEQPQNVGWQVILGELHQQQGNYDRAQQLYESALRTPAPTQTAAKLAAVEDLKLLTVWRGRVNEMLQATQNDNSPFGQKLRGDLLLRDGRRAVPLDEARAAFQRAKAQAPDNFSLAFSIALSLEQAGDATTAQREYEALAKLGLQSVIGVNAMRALIGLHAAAGRHEEAWSLFQTLYAVLDSETAREQERRILLGAYRKRFRLDDLVTLLESKVTQRPPREEAFRMLLDLYEYYGQLLKATDLIAKGAGAFPASGYWRFRQAEPLVAEAASVKPGDPIAKQGEADRKFRDARRLMEQAAAAEPTQFFYRAQMAFVISRGRVFVLGNVPKAEWRADAMNIAMQLVQQFSNDPDALTVYATIEFDQPGATATNALARYQQALEMGKPLGNRFEEVFFIRQMIAQLSLKKPVKPDPDTAVQQYILLFDAAPTLAHEMGTGAAYLGILIGASKENPDILNRIVDLFLYVMREPNTKPDRDLLLNTFLDNIAPQQKPDGTTLNADVRQRVAEAISQKLNEPNADPYLHHLLGRIRAAEGKPDEALSLYEKAADALPQDPDLASWTGDGYLRQARRADAEERALRQQNKAGEADDKAREKQEKYQTAIGWYRKALQLNPSRMDDYYWMAVAYWGLRELNQPAALARKMMLRTPNDFRALNTLARLYLDVGKSAEAVEAARVALARGITDRSVLSDEVISLSLAFAGALAQEGKFSEAEAMFRQIVRPQSGLGNRLQALFSIAELYANYMERKPQAIEVLREALQLKPSKTRQVEILFSISGLQASIGKKDDAVKTLEEALKLDPPAEVKKVIEDRIKELKGGG